MTKLQRKAIATLITHRRDPSVVGTEYGGPLGRVVHNTTSEASRLLESEDYRKGWEACHQAFTDALKFIMDAKPADLKLYARV